jgi:CHAT domain-containing protein
VLAEIKGYGILLFIAHGVGVVDPTDGLRSGLVLAPNTYSASDVNFTGRDIISASPLAARLAVLASCESGLGVQRGGEGLVGLVWAFQAAGCPSIVATQWEIREDDASSAKSITHAGVIGDLFRYLSMGMPKDQALRKAMLNAKRSLPPSAWASFELIGDNSPVDTELRPGSQK